eukprot:TRINITY_DN71126_c0_g1_i1.p1 TRINITY_DN71126_c0_g1~~TRINITY_DN71126_c0_g1_i1.p1  ORF type:complete len:382 (+),score=36.49 TRINITY_DN71126_c0_g1_i1:89-1234(+)
MPAEQAAAGAAPPGGPPPAAAAGPAPHPAVAPWRGRGRGRGRGGAGAATWYPGIGAARGRGGRGAAAAAGPPGRGGAAAAAGPPGGQAAAADEEAQRTCGCKRKRDKQEDDAGSMSAAKKAAIDGSRLDEIDPATARERLRSVFKVSERWGWIIDGTERGWSCQRRVEEQMRMHHETYHLSMRCRSASEHLLTERFIIGEVQEAALARSRVMDSELWAQLRFAHDALRLVWSLRGAAQFWKSTEAGRFLGELACAALAHVKPPGDCALTSVTPPCSLCPEARAFWGAVVIRKGKDSRLPSDLAHHTGLFTPAPRWARVAIYVMCSLAVVPDGVRDLLQQPAVQALGRGMRGQLDSLPQWACNLRLSFELVRPPGCPRLMEF